MFAVSSLWNPYQNAEGLKIAVVSEDAGAKLPQSLKNQLTSNVDEATKQGTPPGGGEIPRSADAAPASEASSSAASLAASDASSSAASPAAADASASAASPAASDASASAASASAESASASAAPANASPVDWNHTYNLGDMLVDSLGQDDSFDWQFVDSDQAWKGLESGEYYAIFIVPSNFTEDFLGVLADDAKHPSVEYWVNEKHNTVALEVTDGGSGAIDALINRQFAASLSDVAADVAKELTNELRGAGLLVGANVQSSLDTAAHELQQISEDLKKSDSSIDKWRETVTAAEGSLSSLSGQVPGLRGMIAGLNDQIAQARNSAQALDDAARKNTKNPAESGLPDADEIVQRVEKLAAEINEKQAEIFQATTRAEEALTQAQAELDDLKAHHPELTTEIAALEAKVSALQAEVQQLKTLSAAISQAAQRVQEVAVEVSTDITTAKEMLESIDTSYNESVLPQVLVSLDSLSLMGSTLDSAVANLGVQADSARELLVKLDDVLVQTKSVLGTTSKKLGTATDSLQSAQSNLKALAGSDTLKNLTSLVDLDVHSYGTFAASPASMQLHPVYTLNSYGAGVSPFYSSLAIWVGCIMLAALLKLEVDPEAFPDVRPWQAYLGRLALFELLAFLQGLIVVLGNLALGVQAVSVPALIGAGLVAAFCFVNVVYALCAMFRHIGKVLAVILLIVQIPGASGMFPVQLMPDFFQAMFPFLPFTYSMSAIRESLGGFYGNVYALDLAWLVACGLAAMVIALIVRPGVLGLNRMFDRKLDHSGLFSVAEVGLHEPALAAAAAGAGVAAGTVTDGGEKAGALDDFGECTQLMAREKTLAGRYDTVRIAAPVTVVVLTVLLGVISCLFTLGTDTQLLLLAIYILLVFAIFCACVSLEFSYDNTTAKLRDAGIDVTSMYADQEAVKTGGAHEKHSAHLQ